MDRIEYKVETIISFLSLSFYPFCFKIHTISRISIFMGGIEYKVEIPFKKKRKKNSRNVVEPSQKYNTKVQDN